VQATAWAARRFLAQQGCAERELMDYELALVEACNNAVQHVGVDGRNQPIVVEILCDQAQVEFRITDHTAGFDWPMQAALPDTQRESGRGLFLISSLMDYAKYFRGPGENVLVIRKRRALSR
jgi:anti-sigma regulatory factor (Ser/Thr protein kinase)